MIKLIVLKNKKKTLIFNRDIVKLNYLISTNKLEISKEKLKKKEENIILTKLKGYNEKELL